MRVFLALLLSLDSLLGMAISNCPPSPVEVDMDISSSCRYGRTRNACDQVVCLKGPGQICGGSYGECSENLQCSVEGRCEGCSFISFRCWDQDINTSTGYYINLDLG